MKNFNFLFSTKDLTEVGFGLVGSVQSICKESEEITNVPAFLLSFRQSYIITFLNNKNVISAFVDSSSLIKNSSLLINKETNTSIGKISFNLDDNGEDFSCVTGLLYPSLKSNLYADSDCNLAVEAKRLEELTIFSLEDIMLGQTQQINSLDAIAYVNATNVVKNKKSFLDFASIMMTSCAGISYHVTVTESQYKAAANRQVANYAIKAQNARAKFAEVLFNEGVNNSSIERIVFEEPQKLLMPSENNNFVIKDAEESIYDGLANAEETVTNINTNTNTEETTMSKFTFDRNAEINSQAKKEDSAEDTIQKTSTVQVTTNNNNTNTEVKTMTVLATSSNSQEQQVINEFEITVEDLQAIKALNLGKPFFLTTSRGNFKLVAEVEALFSNAAPIQAMPVVPSVSVVSEPVEIEANPGMPNSTIAKLRAEQAASNEVVETVEDNNTNTSISKTMPKVNVVRQLESIELVINVIAAAGGDIARKSGAVAKRTESLNVLRNKNQNTVSNIRGYGFIRSNSADDSAFMSVNVFPEKAQTVYQTSNRPIVIFNYNDGTSVKQNTEETEIFWRKVLHAGDDVVIANLNPTLKFDLDVSGDLLRERIDAGTVQAVSVKFNDLSKMFRFWVGNYNVMSILNLSLVSGYEVSMLRDTVELTEDFLGYKSGSAKFNDYSAFSKTNRKGNSAVVGASVGYGDFTPNSVAQPVAPAAQVVAARAVETPVAVAVVVDAEKDALRVENADLKAKVADLTSQVSNLVAGQARMEAMMAQLVAAQTSVVSIPEIVEVVAPVADFEKSEEEILAEMKKAREDFYHSEVTNCGYDDRDEDEQEELVLELKAKDDAIALFVELMPIPVADRETYLVNKAAKKAAEWAAFQASGEMFM